MKKNKKEFVILGKGIPLFFIEAENAYKAMKEFRIVMRNTWICCNSKELEVRKIKSNEKQ